MDNLNAPAASPAWAPWGWPSLPQGVVARRGSWILRLSGTCWAEATVAGSILLLAFAFGPEGLTALALLAAGTAASGRARRWFMHLIQRRRVIRQWHRALMRLWRLGYSPLLRPRFRVTSSSSAPGAVVMSVSLPVGQTATDLEHCAEAIAVAMALREVKVTRDPSNARHVTIRLVSRDPLGESAPAWPCLDAQTSSIWTPVPVGVDEEGRQVALQLIERNVLIGGEPGAGKSSALALLTAAAALDPNVELVLFDGKLVELACWAGSAIHNVGPDVGQAVEVLAELVADLDSRYVSLLANRQRRVTPEDNIPVRVLVFDELAHYFLASERGERASFERFLRDLVARGRAAGIVVLAATQKPQHDVIPTAVRDLFSVRWAMRCTTPQASDTILGSGWAAAGYRACDVPMSSPGVGLLLHEGATPVRMRSHYLSDSDLAHLAKSAEGRRARTAT
jgi:hypothetical protein